MINRAGSLLLFGALGVGAYFVLAPKFPKDQSVNVVLGDAAPSVTEVSMHYASDQDAELARDVTLRFDKGKAPRVVHHEARLPDGDYRVAIEVRSDHVWTKERRVRLEGGSTSIDVAEAAR
jgi:hypothetical protein